jgi:FRG domain
MFYKVRPESWEVTRRFAQQLPRWGFRGHNDASWGLTTTFERFADNYKYPPEDRLDREARMLNHFMRRAHLYVAAPPAKEDGFEWLALIQHYGGPTRLLDFSRSFYVAAFFAVEKAEKEAAIWAIDLEKIEKPEDLAELYRSVKNAEDPQPRRQAVVEILPDRMNQRLSIQQGTFLFPCDISTSFIRNLAGTFGISKESFEEMQAADDKKEEVNISDARIIKIVLRNEIHIDVLRDLKAMNITSESLFPGLEGFARSLYFQLTLNRKSKTSE